MSKLICEENKYDGKRFKVIQKIYERENGLRYIRDCVEPGDAVVILAIDENNNVILIEEEREVIGKIALELPAGMIDEGEKPVEAAKRELEEETGVIAKDFELLLEYYPSCGYTSEISYIYLARNLSKGKVHLDETEEILSVKKIPIEECFQMALEGKFEHASLNLAILMYYFKYVDGGKMNGRT